MDFYEKIPLVMFIIMVIFCIAEAVQIIIWRNRVRQHEYKIAIQHSKLDNYIWMGVALINIAVESILLSNTFHDYSYDTNTMGYLFMVLMWIAFLVYMFIPVVFARKHYVTNEGLLVHDAKSGIYKISEVQYYVKGDSLDLYYNKKLNGAEHYKIIEKKSELTEILAESYTRYEKPIKETKEKKS